MSVVLAEVKRGAVVESRHYGSVAVVNGKKHAVKSGNILLAKPGELRYSHLPFTCNYIHFTLTDPRLAAILEGISTISSVPDTKELRTTFATVASLFCSADPFDNIAASAELIRLLHRIGSKTGKDPDIMSRVRTYMEHHYQESLSTGDIATACDISVPYLHKLFRANLNTTPGAYLLSCRITAARELLINTDRSLSEIAASCGFSSQSYFSDCFKKSVGVPPKDFRKNATYLL